MEGDYQRNQGQPPGQNSQKVQDVPMASTGGNPVEDYQQILPAGPKSVNHNNKSASNENSRSVSKRKYTKRAKPKNDDDSQGSGPGGANRKQGRWSREEKQKFIDGKFQFFKIKYLEPLQTDKFELILVNLYTRHPFISIYCCAQS